MADINPAVSGSVDVENVRGFPALTCSKRGLLDCVVSRIMSCARNTAPRVGTIVPRC